MSPNPWGLIVIGIGVLIIILGVKGSYSNFIKSLKSGASTTSASQIPVTRPRPVLSI